MHAILDILRLRHEAALSERAIARSLRVSRSTVSDVLTRAQLANLNWPLSAEVDEAQLEALLYTKPQGRPVERAEPSWSVIHQELRRKGVTLYLLWMEYKEQHPQGLQYSQFCHRYRQWTKRLQISMRQNHRAGDKLFIDYAGPTMRVVDPVTGESQPAQLFVAVLGASNYTYAEAQPSQSLESFVGGHVRALAFFGGAPALLVPDNLKAAVLKADRYEPTLNRTYAEMASYYGTAVMPARPRRPRDKPKAEVGVQIVERWILAVLRHRVFFSLAELNDAIRELLERLNTKPFQKLEGTRRSLFEAIDRPALRPLPNIPYEYAEWRVARVNIDSHIEVDHAYYSVPHSLLRQEVHARLTSRLVEVYAQGKSVARHERAHHKGATQTVAEHLPKAHQKHLEWSPQRLIAWGRSMGPSTGTMVEGIMERRPHPEQGYRSCLGLLSLSKKYSPERLEQACCRALALGAINAKSVRSILAKGLDRIVVEDESEEPVLRSHEHVRGASYFADPKATGKPRVH